jgi:nucleotide-binding universal stress UspA family protein
MKQILVPTDFSEFAVNALDCAIAIANKTGSEVVLLHVISNSSARATTNNNYNTSSASLHYTKIEQQLDEIARYANTYGISATKSIVEVDDNRSLAKAIMDFPSDLIVMGSQGIGAFKKFFAGSNTSKVLSSTSQPVLVIKEKDATPISFRTIVFASTLEEDTHTAFDQLLQFGKSVGAENFHLVEITTPQNFLPTHILTARMEEYISKHDCKSIMLHQYNHYTVEAGIAEFAKKVEADLIAIANHGRGDISSLFIESIPENLIKYTSFPVLSLRV